MSKSKRRMCGDVSDLATFLAYIGESRGDQYVELRMPNRTDKSLPWQIWIPGNESYEAVRMVLSYAESTDVYVGAAPRARPAGTRDAIERVPLLWVDCDSEESFNRLGEFSPEPTCVIASGTEFHAHAWWRLEKAIPPAAAERANRRLAYAIGADLKVCDRARIMRPPCTFNYKTDPPRPVTMMNITGNVYNVASVVSGLPDPPDMNLPREHRPPIERKHDDDWLLDIPPYVYVEELAERDVNRSGKTECPFHESSSGRSLHVYSTPEKGWYCYGCQKGGDIYQFAALLWGIDTNTNFKALRKRLMETFSEYE